MRIYFIVLLVCIFCASCSRPSGQISKESLSGDAAGSGNPSVSEDSGIDAQDNMTSDDDTAGITDDEQKDGSSNGAKGDGGKDSSAIDSPDNSDRTRGEVGEMKVFVCGAVKSPGVVKINPGERIIDVIDRAGGFGDEADTNYLNLAAPVSDADMIYVPTKAEVEDYLKNSGHIMSGNAVDNNMTSADDKPTADGQCVNINTAGESELMTLPGIGQAKAKKIIDYRNENGSYKSIEEIKNITGIKDGIFESIKDLICV